MHKQRLNELSLSILIEPDGPLLIKSGSESGADPSLPAMNFVRTNHPHSGARTIYLPGSSLKGVIRSHCERIIRTVFQNAPDPTQFCCDPLHQDENCGQRTAGIRDTAEQYRELCLACRIFGHTTHASHFLIADAYPLQAIDDLPVRHGVAIDRLSGGAVPGALFDLEVALEGSFKTSLRLVNFELWQLGLLALALRDLGQGSLQIGFAKSRGLGQVKVALRQILVTYPGQVAPDRYAFQEKLYGVAALAGSEMATAYDFVNNKDTLNFPAPDLIIYDGADWGRATIRLDDGQAIEDLLRHSVAAWVSKVNAYSKRQKMGEGK